MAKNRGFEVVGEETDDGISAWLKGSVDTREGLQNILLGAHRGDFDTVLIWALDRITREGPEVAHRVVRQLREAGAELVSFTEPHIHLTGPTGEIIISIMASMAKQYSDQLSQRVKAGMNRAKNQGIHLGRDRTPVDVALIHQLKEDGYSVRSIALRLGLSKSMVHRRLKEGDE